MSQKSGPKNSSKEQKEPARDLQYRHWASAYLDRNTGLSAYLRWLHRVSPQVAESKESFLTFWSVVDKVKSDRNEARSKALKRISPKKG